MPVKSQKLSRLNLLVQSYEGIQETRKAIMNRLRNWYRDHYPEEDWDDMDFSDEEILDRDDLPIKIPLMNQIYNEFKQFEKDLADLFEGELENYPLWDWLKSQYRIGPVISARLLHRIHGRDFPSLAHLYSQAGLDGDDWRENPHDWGLTVVCAYLIGEQIEYTEIGRTKYREIYDKRKAEELEKDWCGHRKNKKIPGTDLKAGCRHKPENKKIKKIKKLRKNGDKPKADQLEAEIKEADAQKERCTKQHRRYKARRYAVKKFLEDMYAQMNGNGR